ncbi:MAG: hypothetical protein IIC97_01620 [Chloroflexi bacterium]|nr:hypothetical protein [Chloroflexota bacterium]
MNRFLPLRRLRTVKEDIAVPTILPQNLRQAVRGPVRHGLGVQHDVHRFGEPRLRLFKGDDFFGNVTRLAITDVDPCAHRYECILGKYLGLLALLAVVDGDMVSAQDQYAHLESSRGTVLPGGVVSADRLLGLLSVTMGQLDRATSHFEDALALSRRAGRRDHLPGTCYDYADALLKRNGQGDRERAISLLEEALVLSTELGMHPFMERAAGLKAQAESQTVAVPTYPDGLTQREVEVLRLIAGGKTNLEIAEELVIAEGTARRHVANIYEKIGAANRAEATRYALSQGFLSLDDNLSSPA